MSKTLWQRVEAGAERWNVLRHPFYRRWSAGELGAGELARYSGQYRRAVEAIATMSDAVAAELPGREEVRRHAAEERAHVRLWDGFLDAAGGDADAAPTPETRACVRAWTDDAGALAMLARLYALERAQPRISLTKREGLLGPYAFAPGAATAYFDIHAERDYEHAAEARALIEELAAPGDEDRLAAAAEAALRANWRLLDGV